MAEAEEEKKARRRKRNDVWDRRRQNDMESQSKTSWSGKRIV